MDHSAGCSPLVVHFSPTVTGGGGGGTGGGGGGTGGGGGGTGGTGGTSDGAYTYLWDLGNGNTSSLAMPEAVYTSPGTYTVTLTVSNGSAVATATHNVTVYPPPSVSFTAGPAKVCGTPVTFTGNTDGGARTIVSWLWDFGDGSVSSAGPTTSHSYSQTGTAGASLTVTDNYGCTATLDQPALVQVFPALIAGFTSDKSVLCHVSDPVQFTNTSNGPGTLSYAWDFGDGTASGAASPGHVYSAAGSYGVKLTVTNSIGCTSTFSRSTPLNVASYHTDFSFPNPAVCQNSGIAFTDLSTPQATSRQWQIDGTTVSYFDPFSYYFSAPGTHTITLANVFGTCPQQASKSITVNPNPPSTPFSLTTQPGCNTYSVTLTDQSTGSFSRAWAQNYSTAPIFTPGSGASMSFSGFQYNAYYTVALLLTSTEGCSTTITEPVQLTQVFPSIRETSNAPINSCNLAITKTFAFNYAGTLQSFSWDLGDGTSSTDANPTHTYSTPGVYKTVLHYVDANGCSGTTNAIQTLIDKPFSLDFTAPTTVCVGSSVNFSSPSLAAENPLYHSWDFGDGSSSSFNSFHTYTTPGTYTVTLNAMSAGGCQATATKTAYITVLAAPGSYQGHTNTCDDRNVVTFNYTSNNASAVTWDFGDGQTTTTDGSTAQVQHTYAQTGTYYVNISATNGTCTVQNSDQVYVLTKQNPVLTASAAKVCVNGSLNVQLAIARNPAEVNYGFYYDYTPQFFYADGTPFTGYVNFTNGFTPYNNGAFGWTLSGFAAGESGLYVVTKSFALGCTDRSNTIPLTIEGTATAAVTVVKGDICYQSPLVLKDASTAGANNSLVTENWDFGDGVTQALAPGLTVSHAYPNPGQYIVRVTVSDAGGCQTTSAAAVVDANGPKAAFGTSGNTILLGNTLYLYNYTNAYGTTAVTYSWDFGDGTTSTSYSPWHLYAQPGTYTVTLTASDAAGGCTSAVSQVILVKPFNSHFQIATSYVTKSSCPPVLAQFTNTSVGYSSVSWDFGDGGTAGNVNYPSHVYESPGTYTVTLSIYGVGGLIAQYTDVVNVRQPSGSLATTTPSICLGAPAELQAKGKGALGFLFDYGDGSVSSGADSNVAHTYTVAGSYTTVLVVTDTVGCAAAATPAVAVEVHAPPTVTVAPGSPVACLHSSVQLAASGANTYSWSPAEGLDHADVADPVASPLTSTTYMVTGVDGNGCTGGGSTTVKVVQPETMAVRPDSTSVCEGTAVGLTASGTDVYNWIGDVDGLSSVSVGDPQARPAASTHYMVVGSDSYGCFSDTATIAVTVLPVPTVDAGADVEIFAANPVTLMATGSTDVVSWQWTPPDYLSCTDCEQPVCTPKKPEIYTVSVANGVGCTATDTVSVKLICEEARVRIPEAFSPNGDGHNDRFDILGIGEVEHLVIFDRWGGKVFERNHFYAADLSAQWDGMVHGQPAPVGTYVYFVEMTCPTGGAFTRKGTVVLVR